MLQRFEKARRVSVPIVILETADQLATVATLINFSDLHEHPVVQWDAARGITPCGARQPLPPRPGETQQRWQNTPARDRSEEALAKAKIEGPSTIKFSSAMIAAERLPVNTLLLVHNAHRQLQSMDPGSIAANVQALANLRNIYETTFRMVALLSPGMTAPPELMHDVVTIVHELPDAQDLRKLVVRLHNDAPLPVPDDTTLTRAVDALAGLSDFAAKQAGALALTEEGMDIDEAWRQKRGLVRNTPGLSIYRGQDRFSGLIGMDALKGRLAAQYGGRKRMGCVVWMDEGSDVFSNIDQDTTGVKTDQQRVLLMLMEEYNWRGIIITGVPGVGKSAISRALGNEAGVPTIEMDLPGMEAKHVGESEQNMRNAMRVVQQIGQGDAFLVLTCNSLKGIRPQFQRRFKKGIYFQDLPGAEHRVMMWQHYVGLWQLSPEQLVGLPGLPGGIDDSGWTGAEIRECVEDAWTTGSTIAEAARFIIPVAMSRGPEIEAMRREANGRFIDATRGGAYRYVETPIEEKARAIRLPSRPAVASVAAGPSIPS